MRILVIPEDFRKDQYILKPIISAMMSAVGKPKAKVQVCQEPLLGGVGEALKWERIQEVLLFYRGMIDLYLLIVDRDGKAGRRQRLDDLEQLAAEFLPTDRGFFAENAWQEVEVWVLAAHKLPQEWSWQEIRAELDPKELYFDPLVEQRGLHKKPGDVRQILGNLEATRQRPPASTTEYDNFARKTSKASKNALAHGFRVNNEWGLNNLPIYECPALN